MLCKRGLFRRAVSVCLSVHLTVKFVNSVKTSNRILRLFSSFGSQRVSHTPSGGLIPLPQLSRNTPGFRRKGGREGKGGRGKWKGRGKGKGRDPQGLVDTPMFQILKNTLLVAKPF